MAAIEKESKKSTAKSNNSKGGARPGAGRKKGAANKRTAALQKAVEESGITPLDFMLQIMRGQPVYEDPKLQMEATAMRFEAAKAAAPYVHAKLAAVEINANVTHRTLAQELAELNDSGAGGD